MTIKKLKVVGVFVFIIAIAVTLFSNFVMFSGYYYCKDMGQETKVLFEKSFRLKLPDNSKISNFVVSKRLIAEEGVLLSGIKVPNTSLDKMITGIQSPYTRVYTEKKDNLLESGDISSEKNLINESYDEEIYLERILNEWKVKDNASIEYVINVDSKEMKIYVSKDNNGIRNIYLQKRTEVLWDIRKSHIFRKWF